MLSFIYNYLIVMDSTRYNKFIICMRNIVII